MKYSKPTLYLLAAKEAGVIKTNAQFWKLYSNNQNFIQDIYDNDNICEIYEHLVKEISENELTDTTTDMGMISVYDDCFPIINPNIKKNSEKPFLLFYKGNLSILNNINNNVAVIGLIDPDEQIIERERVIVRKLVEKNLVIVSGLAKGCDSIAHQICLESSGKTIAILPSQLSKISPAENRSLAEKIVQNDGLLITEYYKDPISKYEAVNRFIERDRLQAMFSKAVVLIASYRKGEGDSGSRHAMEAAKKYQIERFVMYNPKTDSSNKKFGLNNDFIISKETKPLLANSIDVLEKLKLPALEPGLSKDNSEQLSLSL